MMKAVVFTLGCKVNESESDSLISGLIERGYEVSDKLEKADLYIVNTCAVTSEAEKKSRQMASRITKLNKQAKIIFTGCATQKSPDDFLQKNNAYLVTGSFNKNSILDLLDECGERLFEEPKEFEELLPVRSLRTRTYIKVQDGCNNFCSYCIIPYLRGRTRSRNPQNVLKEIQLTNPKEAIINGINLSAYNYKGTNLTGLMNSLKSVDCRIRLGSLEVNVIDDEFLSALKQLKDFAPHFHLSLQSGSDTVLRRMNRHYKAEEYYQKVCLIRKYFDKPAITTDVIAGFPEETEEEFNETIEFIKKVEFSDIHPFPFSPRKGTVAYKLKDIDGIVKKARLDKLLQLKKHLKEKYINSFIGQTLQFLPEEKNGDYTEGYSQNYIRLYVQNNLDEKIKNVILTKAYKDGAIAQIQKGE